MKNKERTILLLILIGIAMAAGVLAFHKNGSRSTAGTHGTADNSGRIQILPETEYENLAQGLKSGVLSPVDLLWQGAAAAVDLPGRMAESGQNKSGMEEPAGTAAVFIPCDLPLLKTAAKSGADRLCEEILSGLLPADKDASIYVCEDERMEDPQDAVAGGYPFRALLVSGDTASPFQIILTGLPVVCIEKTDSEEIRYKEVHDGRLRFIPLFSQETEEETAQVPGTVDSMGAGGGRGLKCRFHVRGNISSTFEKKPYRIALVNAGGDSLKVSLGGLRADDDWILNPLISDSTRVREMTAYELWDRVSAFSDTPQATSEMIYVELFLDHQYIGLYTLMEPVDGKQLGLSQGDLLYKIDRWDREYPYSDLYEEKEGETEIFNDKGFPCVEIKYPKTWDNTASWGPMQAYHMFSFRSRETDTLTRAGLEPDLDSISSMSLFCALTHAMDNTWKNSFLIAKYAGDSGRDDGNDGPDYKLYRTIWDLNYVFGDVFVYQPDDLYTSFDAGSASAYTPFEDSTYDFEAFLQEDPALNNLLASKWAAWREGGVSAESVCSQARAEMELLTGSGALAREMEQWPQEKTPGAALEEMEEWIRARFAYLDKRFHWNTK